MQNRLWLQQLCKKCCFHINLVRDCICGTPTISIPLINLLFPICVSLSLFLWASYHTFYIEAFARPISHAHTYTPSPTQMHSMMPNKLQSYARLACCKGIMRWKGWNSTTIVVWVRTALWLVHSNAPVTWKSAGPSPTPCLLNHTVLSGWWCTKQRTHRPQEPGGPPVASRTTILYRFPYIQTCSITVWTFAALKYQSTLSVKHSVETKENQRCQLKPDYTGKLSSSKMHHRINQFISLSNFA